MDFKDTLANLIRPALRPHERALEDTLESAWRAQLSEDYETALEKLKAAVQIARSATDQAAEMVALLHEGEIYVLQARYADADNLFETLLTSAQGDTQRSYIFSMMGVLAQTQGDWTAARAAYERALDAGRRASSPSAEGRALGHLGETYLREGNASYAAHLLQEALPKLSSAGDSELNSSFTGLLGLAMIQNGQETEGQQLLDRALRLAEQAGYRIYQRRLALLLGDRALDEGRYPDAYTHYSQALRLLAPDSATPDYVTAVSQMSRACLSLRKPDEAVSYAQTALKSAQALGDAVLQRRAEGAFGMALRALGRGAEAIPYLQAAAVGQDTQVLRNLAAAQADSGDTDGAIATYQRAVQDAGNKPLELAQARRDLGLVYQRQHEYQAAVNEWTAALAIYDERRAYAQVARLYCDIGSARKLLGQRARALKDYEQGLMVLSSLAEADQETRGLVLSNAANAYAEQGDVESADSFFTEAISIAEQLGDEVAETTRNGNYGWFLLLVGRPRRAIATLERALSISQRINATLQAAVQLDNLGLVHDSLGDTTAALEQHRKALALVTDPLWAGQIKANLANTLVAAHSYGEAETLIDEALALGRASNHGELILLALTARAHLRIVQQQPASAEDPLTEALVLARKLDNRRLLAEALSARSQQQAALDRYDDADTAWEEAQRLYAMLHMPQGKLQPVWLRRSATRT